MTIHHVVVGAGVVLEVGGGVVVPRYVTISTITGAAPEVNNVPTRTCALLVGAHTLILHAGTRILLLLQ